MLFKLNQSLNPPTFRSGRVRTCLGGGFTAAGRALFPPLCGPAGRTANRNRFGQKHALRYARQSKARQHFCCEKTVSKREKLSGAFPKDQKPRRPSPGKSFPEPGRGPRTDTFSSTSRGKLLYPFRFCWFLQGEPGGSRASFVFCVAPRLT